MNNWSYQGNRLYWCRDIHSTGFQWKGHDLGLYLNKGHDTVLDHLSTSWTEECVTASPSKLFSQMANHALDSDIRPVDPSQVDHQRQRFKIGSRVQAIDELGRWEEGKVVDYHNKDGICGPVVHFPGWGQEFDVHASPAEIRPLWDPFHCDFGKYFISIYVCVLRW